jgi:hypothetical protein
MKSFVSKIGIVAAVLALPLVSSAQFGGIQQLINANNSGGGGGGDGMLRNLENLVRAIGNILNIVVPIIITIALIVFFWGLVQYIYKSGDEEAREVAVRRIVGGVIAFFVIVSLWGLVYFLQEATGIRANNTVNVIPTVQRYQPQNP